MSKNQRRWTPAALLPLLIILLAAWFRLHQLPGLPPGLNFDEAGNGAAAWDILNGRPRLWWPIGGGKEPLWPYLLAGWTLLLGNTALTLRLAAALSAILTVATLYPLLIRLFRYSDWARPGEARWIARLTMAGLAFSAWHLHFSRLGFRAILLPLLSSLAFYFLWRAFTAPARPGRKGWPVEVGLAAFFAGLTVYAYLAGRLLIFVPPLFFLAYGLFKLKSANPAGPGLARLGLAYALLTGLFLLPLIIYFSLNPAEFVARAGTVSILNPAWRQGHLVGAIWPALRLTLGTFLGLSGDANPLVNLPGQPALPLFLAPFFVLGLLTARSPARPANFFLLVWWAVMLLPALLAPEGAPHHLRLLGAIGPAYALVAVGVVRTSRRLAKIRLRNLLPLALYLLLALQTYTHYFNRWPVAVDFTLPLDLYAVRLAGTMATAAPAESYVLPMDIRAGAEARHYTLDYLLGDRIPPPYVYLPVDERNAENILATAGAANGQLSIVRWNQDKHHEADAKEIVTFLLETNGQRLSRTAFPVYDIELYRLNQPAAFKLPAITSPVQAVFDGLLRLDAAYVQPTVTPGQLLPVALTLAPLAPLTLDYKASIRLLDPAGGRVAQKDRLLLHNFHQGTSLWPPESVNEYYLLPLPPEIPAGNYGVVVVIYRPDTQAPLLANGLVEVPVGSTRVE